MTYTAHYHSPLGGITLTADGTCLTGLWFDNQRQAPHTPDSEVHAAIPVFDETLRWLDLYFSGSVPDRVPPLALHGSAFRQRVWQLLLQIPYGQTVTYGDLARRLGCRSAQAVGGAVGHNPIALIVPCHRVVGAQGALTGYAGGIDRKRALLQLECCSR